MEVEHCIVGGANQFWNLLLRDCGNQVALSDGSLLDQRCWAKSMASSLSVPHNYGSSPGCSLEFEIIRQLNKAMLNCSDFAIDSIEFDIWYTSATAGSSHGYAERILCILDPPFMTRHNAVLFSIPGDNDADQVPTVEVWIRGDTKLQQMSSLDDWQSFHTWLYGQAVINSSMAGILSAPEDGTSGARHSKGALMAKRSRKLLELAFKFGRIAKFGDKSV